MSEKLIESLELLEAKTTSVEEKIRKSREETKERLINRIEESKAELQAKKFRFITHVEEMNAQAGDEMDFYKTSLTRKAEHLIAEVISKKEYIDEKPADYMHEQFIASNEQRYKNLVEFAKALVDWALIALAEVENATLEAFVARIQDEDLNEPYN